MNFERRDTGTIDLIKTWNNVSPFWGNLVAQIFLAKVESYSDVKTEEGAAIALACADMFVRIEKENNEIRSQSNSPQ